MVHTMYVQSFFYGDPQPNGKPPAMYYTINDNTKIKKLRIPYILKNENVLLLLHLAFYTAHMICHPFPGRAWKLRSITTYSYFI